VALLDGPAGRWLRNLFPTNRSLADSIGSSTSLGLTNSLLFCIHHKPKVVGFTAESEFQIDDKQIMNGSRQ
jgi:hypothetical protein